jgi:hypothetical protein
MVMKYEVGGERAGGGGGGRRSYVKVAREGDLEEVAELPTNESGLLHLSTVKVWAVAVTVTVRSRKKKFLCKSGPTFFTSRKMSKFWVGMMV